MIKKRISELHQLQSPLLSICIIGAFLVGITFSVLGVLLVFFGARGQTEITLFNFSFHSANAGIAAILIGAAVTIYIVRAALVTFEKLKNEELLSGSNKFPKLYTDLEKFIGKMSGQKGDDYGEDTKL